MRRLQAVLVALPLAMIVQPIVPASAAITYHKVGVIQENSCYTSPIDGSTLCVSHTFDPITA